MGDFELNITEKPKDLICSIYNLCKEISKEHNDEKEYQVNLLLKKFHNSKRTGIIDHLEDDLQFYVDKYDDFSKCQFLKLMFRYEKIGVEDGNKYRLTEILKRPCLANVNSYYETDNLYGGCLNQLMEELENKIGKELALKRKTMLYQKKQRWNNALAHAIEYAYDEKALAPENRKETEFDLNNIHRFLNDKILGKLEKPQIKAPYDNIFISFYTLLIAHEMVCEEEDRVDSYECIELYPTQVQDYVKKFVVFDKYVLTAEAQDKILNAILGNIQEDTINTFRFLIFGSNRELEKEDYAGLRLAKQTRKTYSNWIATHKPVDNIPKESMIASWFIAMVQEVLYCKRNKVKIKNNAFGIKEGRRTLTAALKSPESAQAKEIQAWMIRLENRYNSDIGSYALQTAREIEKTFAQIRRWTLQFHDWKDLVFVDDALVHMVERIVLPRRIADTMLAQLAESIGKVIEVKIVDYKAMKQQWDLGRELAYDNTAIVRLTKEIVDRARECSRNFIDETYLYNEFIFEFPIRYSNETERKFLTKIAFNGTTLKFILFCEIVSDDIAFQYDSYGIKNMVIN